jgi:hypothetical protein
MPARSDRVYPLKGSATVNEKQVDYIEQINYLCLVGRFLLVRLTAED